MNPYIPISLWTWNSIPCITLQMDLAGTIQKCYATRVVTIYLVSFLVQRDDKSTTPVIRGLFGKYCAKNLRSPITLHVHQPIKVQLVSLHTFWCMIVYKLLNCILNFLFIRAKEESYHSAGMVFFFYAGFSLVLSRLNSFMRPMHIDPLPIDLAFPLCSCQAFLVRPY